MVSTQDAVCISGHDTMCTQWPYKTELPLKSVRQETKLGLITWAPHLHTCVGSTIRNVSWATQHPPVRMKSLAPYLRGMFQKLMLTASGDLGDSSASQIRPTMTYGAALPGEACGAREGRPFELSIELCQPCRETCGAPLISEKQAGLPRLSLAMDFVLGKNISYNISTVLGKDCISGAFPPERSSVFVSYWCVPNSHQQLLCHEFSCSFMNYLSAIAVEQILTLIYDVFVSYCRVTNSHVHLSCIHQLLPCDKFSLSFSFFKDFIYLFMRDIEREEQILTLIYNVFVSYCRATNSYVH